MMTVWQRRDELEEQNMLKKIQQQDGFLEELQANRVANEELYRDTKTALEREIQLLQQELEHMRAFCMLNEEKLDYNYQILKKREDENTIIKSQQKRMLNKLRDELGQLRRRTEEQREWGRQTERTLEREIHKLRESLFQVEAKADLLQTVNDNKYRQVGRHRLPVTGSMNGRTTIAPN